MTEPWHILKVGDRVRFLCFPEGVTNEETLAVYEALIRTGFVLKVEEIDCFGHPWTEPFDVDDTGQVSTESGIGHTLALNDESWERV